jgi:ribonuclease HI
VTELGERAVLGSFVVWQKRRQEWDVEALWVRHPGQPREERCLGELDGQRQQRGRDREEVAGTIRPAWTDVARGTDDEDAARVEREQEANTVFRKHLIEVRERAEGDNTVLRVYTDGSYANGRSGWGWIAVMGSQIIFKRHGPVVTDIHDKRCVGCQFHSNNAGEISALIDAATWLGTRAGGEPSCIIPDSWWAIRAGKGARPRFHWVAARRAARAVLEAGCEIGWIKGHSDHPFNDAADTLADDGRLMVDGQGQQLTGNHHSSTVTSACGN